MLGQQEKWKRKLFVGTLNLTSYLPKFLLDLKDRDGAGVGSFNGGGREVVRITNRMSRFRFFSGVIGGYKEGYGTANRVV